MIKVKGKKIKVGELDKKENKDFLSSFHFNKLDDKLKAEMIDFETDAKNIIYLPLTHDGYKNRSETVIFENRSQAKEVFEKNIKTINELYKSNVERVSHEKVTKSYIKVENLIHFSALFIIMGFCSGCCVIFYGSSNSLFEHLIYNCWVLSVSLIIISCFMYFRTIENAYAKIVDNNKIISDFLKSANEASSVTGLEWREGFKLLWIEVIFSLTSHNGL